MRISDWSSDVCSSDLRAARKPVVDLFGRDRCAIVEGEEPKKRARRPARLQPGVEPRLERIARFITDPACHGAAGLDQLVRAPDRASHLGRRCRDECLAWSLEQRCRAAFKIFQQHERRPDEPRFHPRQRSKIAARPCPPPRSEEHTSELQSLMRISYAVFCLKKTNEQDLPSNI